ncbi:MAG: DUF1588 domain-containing protein [Planctomycetia bacterium]|nr:DUF1588 domain-containing protein [Planctomycetia bacterium]
MARHETPARDHARSEVQLRRRGRIARPAGDGAVLHGDPRGKPADDHLHRSRLHVLHDRLLPAQLRFHPGGRKGGGENTAPGGTQTLPATGDRSRRPLRRAPRPGGDPDGDGQRRGHAGVDTQPVIRGAWVLENILGMPSPPPPKNVPALTPDTRGAKTPRDLLAAHTQESSCALCHARIDPVGFVLENYDPVGRWRAKWPRSEAPIDASGTLPDGTVVKSPVEFKAWLVANIDLFSTCLAEKLMTYATGRVPNYAEKREIEKLVRTNREAGKGFQDLFLDLIDSRTFRAR